MRSKKFISLLMTVIVLVGTTGCSNAEKKSDTSKQESTITAESSNTVTTTPTESTDTKEEKQELGGAVSFMTTDFTGQALQGANAQDVIDYVEEYTNCTLDMTLVPSDAYDSKLSLMLASGDDTPMIVTVPSISASIINYAKAGAFWDLSQFINEEDYPNLSQAIKDVNKNITIDDQLIGVYRTRVLGRYGLGYRQDWAEALGLDAPKTIDDVYEMMYQFTYGDPDGNGVNDTYSLELCGSYWGSFKVMQTWFGVGNEWYEAEDSKLYPTFMQPEYLEALQWFRKCYEDGLWASDFATRETSTWGNDCKNSLAGMFCDVLGTTKNTWNYFEDNNVQNVVDSSKVATFVFSNPIGKTADDVHTLATAGYAGFMVITKNGAKTEEDVKNCLHFLDKMCDDEMMMTSGHGLKGVHWDVDSDGYFVNLREGDDTAGYDYAGFNQITAYIPNTDVSENYPVKFNKRPSEIAQNKMYKINEEVAVMNPSLSYLILSDAYTMNGANLENILNDARVNYVVGLINEDQLKEQWNIWLSSGGQDVIDQINAAR